MAENSENEAGSGTTGVARCPILMESGKKECGRLLHHAAADVDREPACLMHSKDPGKQDETGLLFKAFQLEFEKIITVAGDGLADFRLYVFPALVLDHRKMQAQCRFRGATFTQHASFRHAVFTQNADFRHATFAQTADFHMTAFAEVANFEHTNFIANANFGNADFAKASFFGNADFTGEAYFIRTRFRQNAYFKKRRFKQKVDFTGATFMQSADFTSTTFIQIADFSYASFLGDAQFNEAEFSGPALWISAKILATMVFRRTKFILRTSDTNAHVPPSAVFVRAVFPKPGEIVFDHVDLSRALFYKCDISQIRFEPGVRWAEQGARKKVVFEEILRLKLDKGAIGDTPIPDVDLKIEWKYDEIAEIYQQLIQNYEARIDDWTANEFHYGEMEMQRLDAPKAGQLPSLRRWWHRHLSLIAWYRRASDYGNSYTKPLVWLVGTLLFVALLFPLPCVGIKTDMKPLETYDSAWHAGTNASHCLSCETTLFLESLLLAADTAMFQRSPDFAPIDPLGHAIADAEALLTSTFFALFLLAIRRRFRR